MHLYHQNLLLKLLNQVPKHKEIGPKIIFQKSIWSYSLIQTALINRKIFQKMQFNKILLMKNQINQKKMNLPNKLLIS